jgi:hypothetical protein
MRAVRGTLVTLGLALNGLLAQGCALPQQESTEAKLTSLGSPIHKESEEVSPVLLDQLDRDLQWILERRAPKVEKTARSRSSRRRRVAD